MTLTATAIRSFDEAALDREATETATFATGCFWGPDAAFGTVDGVVRTRVGYAGGTEPDPTYHDIGDHTESFQLDYDPETITYSDLLDRVFDRHDPLHQSGKTQYQNVVFLSDSGEKAALDDLLETSDLPQDAVETRVERLSGFTPAEDYHQKYRLRSRRSPMQAFEDATEDDTALRESPAAAVVNGYAAGHDIGSAPELGLSDGRAVR